MRNAKTFGPMAAALCAGAVTGLFGAGGGMVLVPLLSLTTNWEDDDIFPCSLAIILPICLTGLIITDLRQGLPFADALPYLPGSAIGGLLAGKWGQKIPAKWLHRGLGLLILWGGIRYLC